MAGRMAEGNVPVSSSDHVHFTGEEINRQALANAATLPYLMVAYGRECGLSAGVTALFCGRIFAKGWARLRGTGARAVVRTITVNLVSTGGTLISLTGDNRHAEARVSGLPDPLRLEVFGVSREDVLRFCDVFAPIASYVNCRFAWRVEGEEIVVTVAGPPDLPSTGAGGDAAITDDDIYQQALGNASSLPYLMVALARACGRTPEDAVAFAAARYARLWDPARDNNPVAVARRIALNVLSCGGELMFFDGDEQRAETRIAGVPTEEEVEFFDVALEDVDQVYGMLCLEAQHLGYRAAWRREGNELVFMAERRE